MRKPQIAPAVPTTHVKRINKMTPNMFWMHGRNTPIRVPTRAGREYQKKREKYLFYVSLNGDSEQEQQKRTRKSWWFCASKLNFFSFALLLDACRRQWFSISVQWTVKISIIVRLVSNDRGHRKFSSFYLPIRAEGCGGFVSGSVAAGIVLL